MTTNSGCAALQTEKQSSDLKVLPQVAGNVEWVSDEGAATVSVPLVVTGDWTISHIEHSTRLFAARSASGFHTIVVPKFRPGIWTKILGAPTKVDAVAAEFRSFEWQAVHHTVPGFVVFRTSLHAAKWAEAVGLGTVVLGYRSHLTAGAIVLCSAVLTAKVLSLSLSAQQALYRSIVDEAAAPVRNQAPSIESEPIETPSTLDQFLAEERELGAAYLFGKLLSSEGSQESLSIALKDGLGIALEPAAIVRLSRRLPASTKDEVRAALQEHGWGAYLRRLPMTERTEADLERSKA